jgi:hypothetical protein
VAGEVTRREGKYEEIISYTRNHVYAKNKKKDDRGRKEIEEI